jgi:uncharacterized integral membrane protein
VADDTTSTHERSIRTRQTVRIVVIAVAVALVVAFAVDNSQDVEVGWVVGDGELPLWLVIVGSFLVGGLVGYVGGRRHT